jgi:hypothetical protein
MKSPAGPVVSSTNSDSLAEPGWALMSDPRLTVAILGSTPALGNFGFMECDGSRLSVTSPNYVMNLGNETEMSVPAKHGQAALKRQRSYPYVIFGDGRPTGAK